MARPEPKPCKRFAHQKAWTKALEKHLPKCKACQAVVAYVVRESEFSFYVRKDRNRICAVAYSVSVGNAS